MEESRRLRRELTTLAAMFDMVGREETGRKVLDVADQITTTGEGMPYRQMRDAMLEIADTSNFIGRHMVANLAAILANEIYAHGSRNARRVRPYGTTAAAQVAGGRVRHG